MNDAATLFDLLEAHPSDRLAVIIPEDDRRVTYGELRRQVTALAETLAALGVGRGDRVAMVLPNGLPMIVSVLAAAIAGTAAPLNPAYKETEFQFYLADTRPSALLLPVTGADDARRAAADSVRVVGVAVAEDGTVHVPGETATAAVDMAGPSESALILHTSGSTGRPKRVSLTHANLVSSARNIVATYALSPSDVSLCVMPLFHVHGLVASTLATFASGGTVVVPATFSPLSFWRLAQSFGVTWYSAVPAIHQMLLRRVGEGTARKGGSGALRFIRSCSAPLPARMMHDVEAAFGVPVVEAYGMTEAAHQMASNPLPPGTRRPGSVGAGAGVKISIMDVEGHHLPHGDRGEVVIKGPNVITGYENDPEATSASFVDGWFRTGDEGFLDSTGYLTLSGRIKEQINRGGEKISPREVDVVLLEHPAVAEAVCFSLPHAVWGDEVAAAVVLRASATEDELLTYCRTRLADFKCPTQIHVLSAIPRTATGKIQRRAVAQLFAGREMSESQRP